MWGLYNARFTAGTLRQYTQSYKTFKQWCNSKHVDIDAEAVKSGHHIDNILAVYLTELYLHYDGMGSSGKAKAQHTVFGLLHFQTHLQKSSIHKSLGMLEGWARLKPSVSTPPMSFQIAVAVAVTMAKSGYIEAAIATLLAWDCYLRVSEYCDLQVRHVVEYDDTRNLLPAAAQTNSRWRTGARTVIALPDTKTGLHQSVPVQNAQIDDLLTAYLRHHNKPPTSKVFPFSSAQYTIILHQATHALGIQHVHFTPHSLRRGGATGHFLEKGESALEEIMFRGRWLSYKSLRTYIQMAPSIMAHHSVPRTVLQIGTQYQHTIFTALLPYVTHSTYTL